MANHLLIIGRRKVPSAHSDSDMNAVCEMVLPTETLHIKRCDHPTELPSLVMSVAHCHGEIDLLDLYDHGSAGSLRMGSEILFHSDESPLSTLVGHDIALALGPLLRETAQVRLLGCKTAAVIDEVPSLLAQAGRLLLLKLAHALGGHRVVFGTISSIQCSDFSALGFRRELESRRLFSSLAALDREPPTYQERGRSVDLIRPFMING